MKPQVRRRNQAIVFIICIINIFVVLWYFNVTSTTPSFSPSPFTNPGCPASIRPSLPLRRDINKHERLPTLVIYVHTEADEIRKSNFDYFLENGLCEECHNVDYAFIINGLQINPEIPEHKNIKKILKRENECGEFGAWGQFFAEMDTKTFKKYKRFMFVTDSVRGPYIDPNYLLLFSKDFHYTDIFSGFLTEETRIVGSYIECRDERNSSIEGFSHVLPTSFMLDEVAMQLTQPILKCYDSRFEQMKSGVVGLSRRLIERDINIASLQFAYKGIDFRCNDPMRLQCNNLRPGTQQGEYFGFSVNPMEVVFVKNTEEIIDEKMMDLYSNWTRNSGYLV